MRKNILLFVVCMLLSGFWTGCFEDHSTDADTFVPEILIDTVGIPLLHYLGQFEILQITPKITLEQGVSHELSYKWYLNSVAEIDNKPGYKNYFELVSEEKDLNVQISNPPHSRPYLLWYQVTDETSGYTQDVVWQVKVNTGFRDGLLVASTYDGVNTDLTVVEGASYTLGWSQPDRVTHKLYSSTNGQPMEGIVTDMLSIIDNEVASKVFLCQGKGFYEVVNGDNYTRYGRNAEVIADDRLPLNGTQMFVNGANNIVWVNEGLAYTFYGLNTLGPFLPIDNSYMAIENGMMVFREYEIDDYMAYARESLRPAWAIWYDRVNGAFLYEAYMPDFLGSKMIKEGYDDPFNPENTPGLKTHYAGLCYGDDRVFVMEDQSGNFALYVLSGASCSAKALIDLTGTGIEAATHFLTAENASVIYFTVGNKLYSLNFSEGVADVKERYSASGEISCLSMYRQTGYLRGDYYYEPMPENERALLLGVADGLDGTLLYLPISSPSAGSVHVDGIKSYTGFGKIIAITTQD